LTRLAAVDAVRLSRKTHRFANFVQLSFAFRPIMDWLSGIPYPWCTPDEAIKNIPSIDGLGTIKSYLKQVRN